MEPLDKETLAKFERQHQQIMRGERIDIYKSILNEIAKPITALNKFQIAGVIEHLAGGTIEERLCATALQRLDRYVNLSVQLAKEQAKASTELLSWLESEAGYDASHKT